jgi:hypothetical protein
MKQIVQCARCDMLFDPNTGVPVSDVADEPEAATAKIWPPMSPGYYSAPSGIPPGAALGFAVAALSLGIVGYPLSCLGIPGLACALLAIVFGALSRGNGMGRAGLVLGIILTGLWFVLFIIVLAGLYHYSSLLDRPF